MATVTVEFEVADSRQSARLAERLFEDPDVLTVRVGGPGERSVYRVDVAQDPVVAEAVAVGVATRVAAEMEIPIRPVRVTVTRDGLGDPERGESPDRQDLPWRQAL